MPRPGVSAVVFTTLFPAFVFLTAGEVIKGLGACWWRDGFREVAAWKAWIGGLRVRWVAHGVGLRLLGGRDDIRRVFVPLHFVKVSVLIFTIYEKASVINIFEVWHSQKESKNLYLGSIISIDNREERRTIWVTCPAHIDDIPTSGSLRAGNHRHRQYHTIWIIPYIQNVFSPLLTILLTLTITHSIPTNPPHSPRTILQSPPLSITLTTTIPHRSRNIQHRTCNTNSNTNWNQYQSRDLIWDPWTWREWWGVLEQNVEITERVSLL